MWARGMKRGMDFVNRPTTRRRGARLAILIAIMMAVPGLVAATAFISGGGSGSANANTNPLAAIQCGFVFPGTETTDTAYISTSSIIPAYDAAASPFVSSGSVTIQINTILTGTTGYEYLDGELEIACYDLKGTSLPTQVTVKVVPTGAVSGTGISWAAMSIDNSTGTGGAGPAYTAPATGCATTAPSPDVDFFPSTVTADTSGLTTGVGLIFGSVGDAAFAAIPGCDVIGFSPTLASGWTYTILAANFVTGYQYLGMVSFAFAGDASATAVSPQFSVALTIAGS